MRTTALFITLAAALVGVVAATPAYALMPSTGDITAICVGGYAYNGGNQNSPEYYRNMLFSQGYTANEPRGSLRDYYREASYYDFYKADSQLATPLFGKTGLDVAGDVRLWYQFPDVATDDDPDENSVDWFNGTDQGGIPRTDDFIIKSVQAAARSMFNPTGILYSDPRYDADSDGTIDCIIVYYPEDLNLTPTGGQCYFSYGGSIMGKQIGALIICRSDQGVQTVTHEMGHAMGLPDLYDYGGQDPNASGVGIYDLMCYHWDGAHVGPTGKTDLAWTEPIDVEVVGGEIVVTHSVYDVPAPAKVVTLTLRPYEIYPDLIRFPGTVRGGSFNPNNDEMFYVFNRRRIGFDSRLPGQGIMIWHVDPRVGSNEYEWWPEIADASETPHLFAACEQADGLWEIEKGLNSGNAGDFFGLTAATSKFTRDTRPASKGYGQALPHIEITNMRQSGNDFEITFSLPTFNLTGNITDLSDPANPAPLSGVRVVANYEDPVGTPLQVETYTGPSGGYSFTGLFNNQYTLTATRSGYDVVPLAPATGTATIADADSPANNFTATEQTFDGLTVHVATTSGDLANVEINVPGITPTPTDVLTNAAGAATVNGLSAQSYFVIPHLDGFAFTPAQYIVTFPLDPAVTLPLEFTATPVCSIAGTVTDSVTGLGIEGATVTSLGAGTPAQVDVTTTDETGAYLLSGLTEGEHTISVAKAEYVFAYTGVPAQPVVVDAGTPDVGGVDFSGTRNTYLISGRVTSGVDGLAGVNVHVGGQVIPTDANGDWVTPVGLYKGTYAVTADLDGYVITPASQDATVGPDATGVDFAATQPGASLFTISGRVTVGAAGLPGVTVDVGGTLALTDASGAYAVAGLADGTYTVRPALAPYAFEPESQDVAVNGADEPGIDFAATSTIPGEYSLAGIVTINGAPLANVSVTVGSAVATTDQNGHYLVGGLGAGTYTVTPELVGHSFAADLSGGVFNADGTSVTIDTADVTAANFRATQLVFAIAGRVVDSGTRTGLAGVVVSAGSAVSVTDVNGDFRLGNLFAGTYTPALSKAGYAFTPTPTPITVGPSAAGLSFTAYGTFSKAFGAGWQLFGLPCLPVDASPAAVVGPGVGVRLWDPATAAYAPVGATLEQGAGYWANLAAARTLTVAGTASADEFYMLPLTAGWQLLGNPFSGNLDWRLTRVVSGGTDLSLDDAAAAGWILPYAWSYTGSTPRLIHHYIPGASPVASPWDGFFVYATRAATLVVYPQAGAGAAAAADGFALALSAECAGNTVEGLRFGVAPASRVGTGGFTALAAPSLQGELSVGFVREGRQGASAVEVLSDSARTWTWSVAVNSKAANQPVTLRFGDFRSVPREYDVVLTDQAAGKTLSLRTAGSYVVEGGPEGISRTLTVSIRKAGVGLRISGLTADGSARGACSIVYSLSAPADVTVRVLNMAGREVARVADGTTQDAGAQSVTWLGRSSAGASVASGVYFVELEAVSASGERSRATTQVRLGL